MARVKPCFQLIVFQSDFVLGECLRSVLPYGPMVVTEGPCGYWRDQKFSTSTDQTNAILEAHKDYGQGIIGVKRGQFPEKDAMVNASIDLIPKDTTHLFVVDSDEVWREEDMEVILASLEEYNLDSMAFFADSFFGGFERILTGFERDFEVIRIQRWYPGAKWKTHRPPTILSKDGRPWKDKRHFDASRMLQAGVTMPHYSYVFPSQAKMKHDYYSHYSPGITIPDYYQKVFLPWCRGDAAQKAAIEHQWRGVHNFVPSYRGDCYSTLFEGTHPEEIVKSLPKLQDRFSQELTCETSR